MKGGRKERRGGEEEGEGEEGGKGEGRGGKVRNRKCRGRGREEERESRFQDFGGSTYAPHTLQEHFSEAQSDQTW
jgi:hypothetical protein